jgi:hypothetical protein
MAHILQWHISTDYSVFFVIKEKILSGFAIGHPGQRRVPQLVLYKTREIKINKLY